MTEDTLRKAPPKEGSNRGHDTGHERANITNTMSGEHQKNNSHHGDDGLPSDVEPTEGENDVPQPETSDGKPQE